MIEATFIFILKAITAIVFCLFIAAPFLLIVKAVAAFIHDLYYRR